MTKMPPDLKQGYYYSIKTQKGMPVIGFLLSIFVYVSIFYTFRLSPSNLFNNTEFWFFISNTLILIIAADYGAFSENKNDLYEEYVRRTSHQPRSSSIAPSFVPLPHYSSTTPKEDAADVEEIKEVITSENAKDDVEEKNGENKIEDKKYRRSKSERVKRVNFDESKNVIVRSSSEKLDESPTRQKEEEEKKEEEEEENEFSNMSNEELNRRIEEFIQRQIRLQRGQI